MYTQHSGFTFSCFRFGYNFDYVHQQVEVYLYKPKWPLGLIPMDTAETLSLNINWNDWEKQPNSKTKEIKIV